MFTARDARVEGTRVTLETHPGNDRIGLWTDAAEWTFTVTTSGSFLPVATAGQPASSP